jgi:hypothetical protein
MPFNDRYRAKVARHVGSYVGEPPGGVTEEAIHALKDRELTRTDVRVPDHLEQLTRKGVPTFPRSLNALGLDGRALVVAGDVLTGRWRDGITLIVAPGEPARDPNEERFSRALRWRVAVHANCPAEPLRMTPYLFEERSVGWIVHLLGDYYNLLAARDQQVAGQVADSVGWVVRETRFAIVATIARLRPHVDRQPHPDIVSEAQPALRELVLDASRAFGQPWIDDVLGPWAHLLRTDCGPRDAYIDDGHQAVERFLQRASPTR